MLYSRSITQRFNSNSYQWGDGLSHGPSVLHRHRCLVVPPPKTSEHDLVPTPHCILTVFSFRPLPTQCFHLPPPVSHTFNLSQDTISNQHPFVLSPSVTFVATSDVVLSLPNPKQLEAGEFDLDELVKKLMEALAEDSQRNEILRLTGDVAVSVIECLDKVSEIESRSWMLSLYHVLGHLFRHLQDHPRYSSTLKSVLHDLETLSQLSTSPSLLLDQPGSGSAPKHSVYLGNVCRSLYRDTRGQSCGRKGVEDFRT